VLVAGGIAASGTLQNAALYDPASKTWSTTGSMQTARVIHTATLLPSGKVVVTGGDNSSGTLASVEVYDPNTGVWTATGALANARDFHTANLMPSGQVLVAGGRSASQDPMNDTEIYDPGLAPVAARQPDLISAGASLVQGSAFSANAAGSTTSASSGATTATGFMPRMEGSGGGSTASSGNVPVLQVQRIDNGQTRFLARSASVNTTDTRFSSSADALRCFPPGPLLLRAWVNGVPSATLAVNLASDTIFADAFDGLACPF